MRWEGAAVVVAGLGISGAAAASALLDRGARVMVVDERADAGSLRRAGSLEELGARVRLGAEAAATLPPGTSALVVSPGWRPRAPLVVAARADGVPVWSEVELAWRLRGEDAAAWLCVTGTNGKTTTVRMLASVLAAAGLASAAVGNVGDPVTTAVTGRRLDVLAVELSSFQLHWSLTVSPEAAALLNVATDHLDWYDGALPEYIGDKGRIYRGVRRAAIYNSDDDVTARLAEQAGTMPGCRRVGFTLAPPPLGALGVVDDVLVDRAFDIAGRGDGHPLAELADIAAPAPHNVANALAAAALARAYGVPPAAVRAGLRAHVSDPHRIQLVATIAGVSYVDDSKATNPHAALASLRGFAPVVWVAGGLAKGARFDELVPAVRDRLRGVVLLGADRRLLADALARHAPDVPVVVVEGRETGTVMDRVVDAAARLSRSGDTVLMAPGCASQDMFVNYGARGDAFAAAVARHGSRRPEGNSTR